MSVARRRPGLQEKWRYVFDSLESIIPIYETGSSRIALFSDISMRERVVRFAVAPGSLVLDLGSGPGTMSRVATRAGGRLVLLDASRKMLLAAGDNDRVQAVFENLPFREGVFDSVIAGFSLRDSRDLGAALNEIRRAVRRGGRFAFCDLGKSDSFGKAVLLGVYLRTVVPIIGAATGGRSGLKFRSLFQTYVLTLTNGTLSDLLSRSFSKVTVDARNLGGSIVVTCSA